MKYLKYFNENGSRNIFYQLFHLNFFKKLINITIKYEYN